MCAIIISGISSQIVLINKYWNHHFSLFSTTFPLYALRFLLQQVTTDHVQQAFSTLLLSTFCLHFLSTYFQHFVFSLSTYYDHTAFSLYTQLHKPTFCCKSFDLLTTNSLFSVTAHLQPKYCFHSLLTSDILFAFSTYFHPFCLFLVITFLQPTLYLKNCLWYLHWINILFSVSLPTYNEYFASSFYTHNQQSVFKQSTYSQQSFFSLSTHLQSMFGLFT